MWGWGVVELLGCPEPSAPSPQIKSHMEKLLAKKKEMTEKWDKHWEWLQQSECHPERTPGGHRVLGWTSDIGATLGVGGNTRFGGGC